MLVLGTEELMYAPLRLAAVLERRWRPFGCATSRRPARQSHPIDRAGYAVRCALAFAAPDEPERRSFVYNVRPGRADRPTTSSSSPMEGRPVRCVEALRGCAPVTEVLLRDEVEPSERPESRARGRPRSAPTSRPDVTFLLKDLGEVAIERGTEEREELIQTGTHYAEMLPVEYQPPAAYVELFEAALQRSATRLAVAVGVVAELIRAAKPDPVLVSLARAGTPVGVLLRRWLGWRHGLDVPHYSVSIVRGRGIDQVAMQWLMRRHDPAALQFVDGWTGKGAISRELSAAVLPLGLDDTLAVLADPGRCAPVYRHPRRFPDPQRVPEFNGEWAGEPHGAQRPVDRPGRIPRRQDVSRAGRCGRLAALHRDGAGGLSGRRRRGGRVWPELAAADRTPTWEGWREVEAVAARVRDP